MQTLQTPRVESDSRREIDAWLRQFKKTQLNIYNAAPAFDQWETASQTITMQMNFLHEDIQKINDEATKEWKRVSEVLATRPGTGGIFERYARLMRQRGLLDDKWKDWAMVNLTMDTDVRGMVRPVVDQAKSSVLQDEYLKRLEGVLKHNQKVNEDGMKLIKDVLSNEILPLKNLVIAQQKDIEDMRRRYVEQNMVTQFAIKELEKYKGPQFADSVRHELDRQNAIVDIPERKPDPVQAPQIPQAPKPPADKPKDPVSSGDNDFLDDDVEITLDEDDDINNTN